MKYLILVVASLFITNNSACQSYSAMTYNIRYDNPGDGINRWDNRKEWLAEQVQEFTPDFLGIQEGLYHQLQFLDSTLTPYNYVGVGRDDGKTEGEYSAILYNEEKFSVVETHTFWLSETPDKPSVGWDASMERICTYALFQEKNSGQHIRVFNAHLDHLGADSRLESLKLIYSKISALNTENYPVLLMGDFNAVPGSKPITFLASQLKDSRSSSETQPKGPVKTFNEFKPDSLLRRLDYIFANDLISVKSYAVVNEIKEGRTPSDHLPVFITFDIEKK